MAFKGRERNDFVSVIPDDLKLFDAIDIVKVFEYMEKTFRLSKDWYIEYKKELLRVQRGISEQEFFFDFAMKNIDPGLQRILRRKDSVILALSRYIIADKIKAKKQEENHLRNFYRSGEWKRSNKD